MKVARALTGDRARERGAENIIEKEQQQQHEHTAAIDDVSLPDAAELGGGADVHVPRLSVGALAVWTYSFDRTRGRRRRR